MKRPAPSSRTSTAPCTGSSPWAPLRAGTCGKSASLPSSRTRAPTWRTTRSWTEGPPTHWRVPLSADHYLTDAWKLWGALAEADRAEYGRAPEGRQLCYHCKLPTDEPIPVGVEDSDSAVGKVTYACPAHAPL
ncbi:hypothetical protein SANTM175S_00981 [Streptomyces antimycoticus]